MKILVSISIICSLCCFMSISAQESLKKFKTRIVGFDVSPNRKYISQVSWEKPVGIRNELIDATGLVTMIDSSDIMQDPSMMSVCFLSDNKLLYGKGASSIYMYDPSEKLSTKMVELEGVDMIHKLRYDPARHLLFVNINSYKRNKREIIVLDSNNNWQVKHRFSLPVDRNVLSMSVLPQGELIYTTLETKEGSRKVKAFIWNKESEPRDITDSVREVVPPFISIEAVPESNTLYVSTQNGIYKVNEKMDQSEKILEYPDDNYAQFICVDQSGTVLYYKLINNYMLQTLLLNQ